MESLISQLESIKGKKIESLKEITDADLDSININFSLEENTFRVPHSLRILGTEAPYSMSTIILIFVDSIDESLGIDM